MIVKSIYLLSVRALHLGEVEKGRWRDSSHRAISHSALHNALLSDDKLL